MFKYFQSHNLFDKMASNVRTRLNAATHLLRRSEHHLCSKFADADTSRIDNERVTLCRHTKRSNCVGTALYIIGAQKEDRSVDLVDSDLESLTAYLKKLEQIPAPIEGCLVVWEGLIPITHIGVVTSVNPLLITNRHGAGGSFVEDESFEDLNRKYQSTACESQMNKRIRYYLPRISVQYMANGPGVP
jgi:hypothetical protein